MNPGASALLRTLVLTGDAVFKSIDREAYGELWLMGYVARRANGTGKVHVTRRGFLKGLAEGWIDKHPDDLEPMTVKLARLRAHQESVARWGPGR